MTVSPQERQRVAALALATLRALGREDLISLLVIRWEARFTSRMGDALLAQKCGARLRFSASLWPRASATERDETVVHEVAHLVACHEASLRGRTVRSAHGHEWLAVMRRAGYAHPSVRHHVDRGELARTRRTEVVYCRCGEHRVVPRMLASIRCGVQYRCCTCQGFLSELPDGAILRRGK